jgi:hypothetical protein
MKEEPREVLYAVKLQSLCETFFVFSHSLLFVLAGKVMNESTGIFDYQVFVLIKALG